MDCVPKAALKRAFDAAFSEEPDVALGYHTPDGDYALRGQLAEAPALDHARPIGQLRGLEQLDLGAAGRDVDDEDFKSIGIVRAKFHGEWNYTISPMRRVVICP